MKNEKKIQGVILAAGGGTRLYPLTKDTPKPLLPVGGKPMILYVVKQLVESGVKDVLIVIRKEDEKKFKEVFGNGTKYGIENLQFAFQSPDVKGIPSAISAAKDLISADKILVVCGDVLIEESISEGVRDFLSQEKGARIIGIQIEDTAGYSPILSEEEKVTSFLPKDKNRHIPGIIDAGTYMFHKDVFDQIKKVKPSERGETEIWDLNQIYADREELYLSSVAGWWSDVGYNIETYMEVDKRYGKK